MSETASVSALGAAGDTTAAHADTTAAHADTLRYPIGQHQRREDYSDAERRALLKRLEAQPTVLRAAVDALTDPQFDTAYRPGGWSVRQLVHHMADSHMNMYMRVKLGLTEHEPTVKTYDQDAWVQLADISSVAPAVSLALFELTHQRILAVLEAISPSDFRRGVMHPENGRMTVDDIVALYAWHGDHHIAHIRNLRERNGW